MITRHRVEGITELNTLLETFPETAKIVLFFSGKEDEEGKSWCSDCQVAGPILEEILKELEGKEEKTFEFVHVSVGTREEWKDPNCEFRTDQRFKLTSIPTLMIHKAVERLNDSECQDKENIKALLEEINN